MAVMLNAEITAIRKRVLFAWSIGAERDANKLTDADALGFAEGNPDSECGWLKKSYNRFL
ncbi:MAG: hypothetical protein GXY50_00360 [Syntrophomonadaceae bacterium]|nr:hypothetical protein [Syntrophomonadaceae bacterium]